jgi:DNA-binding response OmpR family regulator
MQLLARRHFSVTSVASLGEAREAAARERFHLLISDIGLPDGNGCELMSELRGSQGLSGIALTGYGMENDIARTREAGFATHLIKPLSVQSLEKAIAHVLADGGGR